MSVNLKTKLNYIIA